MEELTEERLEEIRENFAAQLRRYRIAELVTVLVLVGILVYLRTDVEMRYVAGVSLIVLLVAIGIWAHVIRLRCPACNRHVEISRVDFCPRCGVPLK